MNAADIFAISNDVNRYYILASLKSFICGD